MSATELDLPVLASADQIRRREFVTIRRGYDPDQVRDFLERVAGQVQQMEAMIREARLEVEAALRTSSESRIDPYQQLSARFTDVIRSADEASERVRREAREDAERMLSEARADADRVRTDAQAKAEEARGSADRALREARDQADRTIAGLSTRREMLVDQLAQMQVRLLDVADQLGSAMEVRDELDTDPDTVIIGEAEGISQPDGAEADGGDELFSMPGARAEVWAGTEARPNAEPSDDESWDEIETIALEVPIIPPLDLYWGEDETDD